MSANQNTTESSSAPQQGTGVNTRPDWEVNEAFENHVPFAFETFPEDVGSLLSQEQPSTQWKIIQRLKVCFDASSNTANEKLWERAGTSLIHHVIRESTHLNSTAETFETLWTWLGPELQDMLSLMPDVTAQCATAIGARLACGVEMNDGLLETIKSSWTKRLAAGKLKDPSQANRILSLIDLAQMSPWPQLIPYGHEADQFSVRLKVCWIVSRIFSRKSDVMDLIRAVTPYSIALRWNLLGWSVWPLRHSLFSENLPVDSLVQVEDEPDLTKAAEGLQKEWKAALLSLVLVTSLCTGDPNEHSSWIDPVMLAGEASGNYYCPELLQLSALIIVSFTKLKPQQFVPPFLQSDIAELVDHAILLVVEYVEMLACTTSAANVVVDHWLGPCCKHLENSGHLERARPLQSLIEKVKGDLIRPMSLLHRRPRGVKLFEPTVVDIRDPEFYQKAKTFRIDIEARKSIDDRKLKKEYNRDRRGAAKQIRREADVIATIQSKDYSLTVKRKLDTQKRIEKDLAADAVELEKMRTGLSKDLIRTKKPVKPAGSRTLRKR